MILLVLFWSLPQVASRASAETVTGKASATGGDSLRIGAEEFFLNGITAPKDDSVSRTLLDELVSTSGVTCDVQEVTQGSRRTAICASDGKVLSDSMVRAGLVFAFPENGVDLSASQSEARRADLGIWRSEEVNITADAIAAGSLPPRDCAIKGNRSQQAPYELKYHLPEFAYYSRTRINLQKHEQWFCSEADAQAAGFVRAAR